MAEWEKLIEDKRAEIEETLKNALRLSYENHSLCRVVITPDGVLHTFEDASHGGETIDGDYLEIANFDNRLDVLPDDLCNYDDVMIEIYENHMNEAEREAYEKAKAEYKRNFDEEMSDHKKVKWIKRNCESVVKITREKALNYLLSDLEFDEIISSAIEKAQKGE